MKKKKGPKDATFAKAPRVIGPRKPKAPFVDPRGTLEQRVDQLSDRVRALERKFEDAPNPSAAPSEPEEMDGSG